MDGGGMVWGGVKRTALKGHKTVSKKEEKEKGERQNVLENDEKFVRIKKLKKKWMTSGFVVIAAAHVKMREWHQ